jgi:hypothetical protein
VSDPFSAFEWDDNKRRLNIEKHGIDFADATEVFDDPNQRTYRSTTESGEERYLSIGMFRGRLITVIFTRRGEKIRIISARAARRNERERYDG